MKASEMASRNEGKEFKQEAKKRGRLRIGYRVCYGVSAGAVVYVSLGLLYAHGPLVYVAVGLTGLCLAEVILAKLFSQPLEGWYWGWLQKLRSRLSG